MKPSSWWIAFGLAFMLVGIGFRILGVPTSFNAIAAIVCLGIASIHIRFEDGPK